MQGLDQPPYLQQTETEKKKLEKKSQHLGSGVTVVLLLLFSDCFASCAWTLNVSNHNEWIIGGQSTENPYNLSPFGCQSQMQCMRAQVM